MVPGLYRAPLTKLLLAVCIVGTILSGSAASKGQLLFSASNRALLLDKGQWWRLATSLFASDGLAEGLLSWFLLYRFRVVERQFGTAKFTLFVMMCLLWALGIRSALILSPALSGVASGPYELLFALFACYYALVPRLHPDYFAVGRLRFSDKAITYALGAQLAASGGLRSAVAAAAGLLFGALYLLDLCGCASRLRCPQGCRRLGGAVFLSFWEATSPGEAAARAEAARAARAQAERDREQAEAQAIWQRLNGQGGPRGAAAARRGPGAPPIDPAAVAAMVAALQAGTVAAANGAAAAPPAPARSPSAAAAGSRGAADAELPAADPEALERLVAMGFDRSAAERALRAAFNNEEAAANRLLEL